MSGQMNGKVAESLPPPPALDYERFLGAKTLTFPASGIDVDECELHPSLFPFQMDLVRWALRKGRSAIFATTGMGKTRMQVEWARLTGERVLIVAPLAVAHQTIDEASKISVPIRYSRDGIAHDGITITNYEMVHKFSARDFGAVVLDESSILKSHDGKTRSALIKQFSQTPYRLCCTATPAPNDISEIANHAEFLGVMNRVEMLATFFVHDERDWRLKGHAEGPFYEWLASWGMSLQKPSDLGYPDDGFDLPPLSILPRFVASDYVPAGQLFATTLKGVTDRTKVRKETIDDRVRAAVDLIRAEADEPWLIWCGLNDEGNALAEALPGALHVEGSQSPEAKADALQAFAAGDAQWLITKPSIAGFGMNFQRCARMVFVGLGDSYEQYFQAIRRCYRFGQDREVHAHIVLSSLEEPIYHNVLSKEKDAKRIADELVKHVIEYERAELGSARQTIPYEPTVPMQLPEWIGVAA
jgi:superfamily II DNA or RNA helicase